MAVFKKDFLLSLVDFWFPKFIHYNLTLFNLWEKLGLFPIKLNSVDFKCQRKGPFAFYIRSFLNFLLWVYLLYLIATLLLSLVDKRLFNLNHVPFHAVMCLVYAFALVISRSFYGPRSEFTIVFNHINTFLKPARPKSLQDLFLASIPMVHILIHVGGIALFAFDSSWLISPTFFIVANQDWLGPWFGISKAGVQLLTVLLITDGVYQLHTNTYVQLGLLEVWIGRHRRVKNSLTNRSAIRATGRENVYDAYKQLRINQVLVRLFSLCDSDALYLGKTFCLAAPILCLPLVINGKVTSWMVAGFYTYCSIMAILAYVIVYDKAFSIPMRVRELKCLAAIQAVRYLSPLDFAILRRKIRSIAENGIKVGSFQEFQRASCLLFISFLFEKLVAILIFTRVK